MKVRELNPELIGKSLLGIPVASFHANHTYPKSTIKDYIDIQDDDLEGQFVKDMLTLKTNEIIDKWYGGKESAMNLILEINKRRWEERKGPK